MSDLDKKYPLRLDTRINFKNLIPHFYISDNETSDFFIKLTNDNEPVEVENIIVAIAVINPNEKLNSCFLDTKSEKGLIYCNLPNQLKNVVGAYKARIMCISGNERIISNTFEYKVDEDEFQLLDEITEGSDELIILSEMLSRLSSIEQQEDDRKANEEERKANELARQEVEAKRVEAEEGRKTQEAERQTNEADRKEAETRRVFEENARQATEKTRVSAENQRTSNENARKSNENIRVFNENARVGSEKNRQTAESERVADEKLRKEAEVVREDQEAIRQANEKERKANETKRIKNEEKREQLYEDSLNLKSEIEYDVIERDKAEAERVANEEQRVRAEQQRAEDYRNRQQAELDRIANERTRQTNEQARIQAENARKNNESIRISGENLRSNAENARKQAEKDRVQAENERKARETNMLNNEIKRQANEGERVANEEARIESENTRIANELERVSKTSIMDERETIRQDEENKRLQAELDRQLIETERRRKEQIRIENEEARVSNETLRVANEDERLAKEAERLAKETERITAENARIEAENTRLANEIQRKEFIDGYEGRLEYVESQYTNQDDRFTRVEDKNKEQDARIKQLEANNKQQTTVINGLLNLHGDGNLCIEDDGNNTTLVNSIEGKVQIDNLTGNTMVNSIKNPDDEYTLNGDIDVSAQSTTLTNAVDDGQVDILAEGNTMVNVSKTKDEAPITKEYPVDVASEVEFQGDIDGKARVKLTGHTLVNVADELNDVTTSTEVFSGSDRSIPEAGCSKVEIVDMVGNTMVNSIKNPDDELTLNGDINTSGQSVTLTTAVDNGQVDVLAEGNTMVNVCDQEEAIAITKSYTVETGNHISLEGDYDGKCRPVIHGNTLVNLVNIDSFDNVNNRFTISEDDYISRNTSDWINAKFTNISLFKPSTTYTIILDIKENTFDSTIRIQNNSKAMFGSFSFCCGGETGVFIQVATTPSDISTYDYSLYINNSISASGTISFRVMILEGDYTNKPIPDYFTGMQSSFEDKVVPENLIDFEPIALTSSKNYQVSNFKVNKKYTVYLDINNTGTSNFQCGFTDNGATKWYGETILSNSTGTYTKVIIPTEGATLFRIYLSEMATINNLIIVEGDYTNYDFSDYDPTKAGKYKVDYKVTGKNKFDINGIFSSNISTYPNLPNGTSIAGNTISMRKGSSGIITVIYPIRVEVGKSYTISCEITCEGDNMNYPIRIGTAKNDYDLSYVGFNSVGFKQHTFVANDEIIGIKFYCSQNQDNFTVSNIQLEEGTEATAYEPYKEHTKTYYLNSPLLEGDTIEESNGNVVHVHKYGKVVLDGSDDEAWNKSSSQSVDGSYLYQIFVINSEKLKFQSTNNKSYECICDKLFTEQADLNWLADKKFNNSISLNVQGNISIRTTYATLDEFKAWLQSNPLTIVARRQTTNYELISQNDSILTDSYVAGHLDFDTAVPVEKVDFLWWFEDLKYLYSNTSYNVQFEADNIGEIIMYFQGGTPSGRLEVVKGLNKFTLSTPSTLPTYNPYRFNITGIGFNASNIVVTEATEGDFGYFKGMKSVGEQEGNKIEILSRNKNVLKLDGNQNLNCTVSNNIVTTNTLTGSYKWIKLDCNNQVLRKGYYIVSFDVEILSGTLTDQRINACQVHKYAGGNPVSTINITNIQRTMSSKIKFGFDVIKDTPIEHLFIQIAGTTTDAIIKITNLQIEKAESSSTENTTYVPHASNKKQILLNEPLRKVGDIADRYVLIDGKWYIERNCGSVLMTDGYTYTNSNSPDCIILTMNLNDTIKNTVVVKTNTLPYIRYGYSKNIKCVSTYGNSVNDTGVYISIPKTELITADYDGIKDWLNKNPTTIIYPLASPVYEPIEIAPKLNTYTDVTHITNNSTIPMNMNIKNSGYEIIAKPSTKYTVVGMTNGRIGDSTIVNGVITTPATLDDPFLRPYGTSKTSKVMLLEGDISNPPAFFSGMRSCFDQEYDEVKGKWKVNIRVVGKNLFDGKIELGNINNSNGTVSPSNNSVRSVNFIPVMSGSVITVSNDMNYCNYIYEYDNNYNFIKYTGVSSEKGSKTITLDNNTKFIKFRSISSDMENNLDVKYQVEYSEKASEYEPYTYNDITIYINEPLRKGDIIKAENRKILVERHMGELVLDGSENYIIVNTTSELIEFNTDKISYDTPCECNSFINYNAGDFERICISPYGIYVKIHKAKLPTQDTAGFKQWLSENPVTIIYQLASPVIEEVETDYTRLMLESYDKGSIHIDTIIPPKETKAKYLTKSVVSTEDLGSFEGNYASLQNENDGFMNVGMTGRTMVNVCSQKEPVAITKSYTVESGNHIALQGEYDGKARPVVTGNTLVNIVQSYNKGVNTVMLRHGGLLKTNTTYTLITPAFDSNVNEMYVGYNGSDVLVNYQSSNIVSFNTGDSILSDFIYCYYKGNDSVTYINNVPFKYIILEGDYTNKPIPNYFEGMQSSFEDKLVTQEMVDNGKELADNLGKYRVDYKVTGKNKLDITQEPTKAYVDYTINNNSITLTCNTDTTAGKNVSWIFLAKANTQYILKGTFDNPSGNSIYLRISSIDNSFNAYGTNCTETSGESYVKFSFTQDTYVRLMIYSGIYNTNCEVGSVVTWSNLQLEEGDTATTYEPYKEQIKTYYLNSPLLEGDTIEDNGNDVVHVHRYGKVVLNGDENWNSFNDTRTNTFSVQVNINHNFVTGSSGNTASHFSNYHLNKYSYQQNDNTHFYCETNKISFYFPKAFASNLNELKSKFNSVPLELIFKLASPTREVISQNDSILQDSYVGGSLDVDTAVPIDKVAFQRTNFRQLKYLYENTDYIVQFESDNVGTLKNIYLGASFKQNALPNSVVKGINKVIVNSGTNITYNYISFDGIGFNASNIVVTPAIESDFEYFEGMKSSYEDKYNEVIGKYEAGVKVVGKNLFNGEYLKDKRLGATGLPYTTTDYCLTDFIKIPKGKTIYTNLLTQWGYWGIYDENYNFIERFMYNTQKYHVMPDNATYVRYTTKEDFTNLILSFEEVTEYEPYHEEIRKVYLNSPLLEGDEIVVKGDGLYHKHNYGSIVLDGSSDEVYQLGSSDGNFWYAIDTVRTTGSLAKPCVSDKLIDTCSYADMRTTVNSMYHNSSRLYINLGSNITSSAQVNTYLQTNPIKVIFELETPTYEKISDDILLLPITTNSSVITETAVPVTSINNNITELELRYLYANKAYTVQFISDKAGNVTIDLGGFSASYSVVEGLNTLNITTPATHNKLVMTSGDCKIRELVVVDSTEPNIKYFTGLESSYENGIVELSSVNADGEKVTKTYELTSPLLEHDILEEINGVPYHVHRYNKIVLDGSDDERWSEHSAGANEYVNSFIIFDTDGISGINTAICDKMMIKSQWDVSEEGIWFDNNCIITISKSKAGNVSEFKSFLASNPITVVYQLASPIYEELQETLQVDSYVGGKLVLSDTNVPLKAIGFNSFKETLTYLYPNTSYNIQFNATATGKINITLGGTAIAQQDVVKGLNKFTVTTPETLVDNCLVIDGIGININEVVVTQATTNEFGYFEGMKSVGELEENKIEILSNNNGSLSNISTHNFNTDGNVVEHRLLEPIKTGESFKVCYTNNSSKNTALGLKLHYPFGTRFVEFGGVGSHSCIFTNNYGETLTSISTYRDNNYDGLVIENFSITKVKNIEDTSFVDYKPYQSNKKEILLNEPLRAVGGVKDRFVKIDGKWYIERRCGEVVLDGSQNWDNYLGNTLMQCYLPNSVTTGKSKCDNIVPKTYQELDSIDTYGIAVITDAIRARIPNVTTLSEIDEYFTNNHTRVVYCLASPVYEPIEIAPTLNTYTDVTHLSNNSTIPMTMNVKNSGYECIIKPSTQYTVSGVTSGKIGTSEIIDGKITTPSTITDSFLRPYGSGKVNNVMLLEGNVENIPEYFTGIKSVFEDMKVTDEADENFGKYKAEVKVVGKNKLNPDYIAREILESQTINGVQITYNADGTITLNGTCTENTWLFSFIDISKYLTNGKTYIVSGLYMAITNKDGSSEYNEFVMSEKVEKVEIYLQMLTDDEFNNTILKPQLEEGNTATEYEPYHETKQTLYLDEPLYNNNVMTVHDNKLGYWKNWDKVVLDGSDDENYTISGSAFSIKNILNFDNTLTAWQDIVSRLRSNYEVSTEGTLYNGTSFGIGYKTSNQALRIRIHNINTVNDLRQHLSQNPITVVYQLAEPVFVPVIEDAPDWVLESFDNCSIHINSGIPIKSVKYLYSGLQAERIVEQTITDNVLTLTKDKLQTATMSNNTTINLPTPLGYTEIHLFFVAQSDLVVTCPSAKWSTTPNLSANKTYEFIFLYINETVGWLAYVREFS